MRVLIDTDVILDYFLDRQPHHSVSEDILLRVARQEFVGYVSSITPVNTYYFGRKLKGKDVALESIRGLLRLVDIAGTTKDVLEDAFQLGFSDYEDAVQCASAIAEGLDAIVTRNLKDYAVSPVTVYSPGEFLAFLDADKSSVE